MLAEAQFSRTFLLIFLQILSNIFLIFLRDIFYENISARNSGELERVGEERICWQRPA